ncbi:Snf7 domain-containing protein [Trichoderma austrokoningii]
MESLKAVFIKPDPQTQLRKCNALIRSNSRKLDREIANTKQQEIRAKNFILQADKRSKRDPQRHAQAQQEIQVFARELIRYRKTSARLITAKAQLSSVQMQVSEAFAIRKIEGSIRAGVGVMRDVNRLIRLPELADSMQELSRELMKAGVSEEMAQEILPEDGLVEFEDEAAQGEIDKVLGEIFGEQIAVTDELPSTPELTVTGKKPNKQEEEEEEEEDTTAMMDDMRNRLEALRS